MASKSVRSLEGVIGAYRFLDLIGAHKVFINAARDPIIVGAGLAEILLQKGNGLIANVEAGGRYPTR
jgi:hypothetical protein